MNKIRVYNSTEIKILLSNSNVDYIKNKSQIKYNNKFKLWAVLQKINYPEKTAREIFEAGGFDMRILDERTPQKRLCSWVKKYKAFGSEYFIGKNKYTYKAIEKNNIQNKKYLLKISGELSICELNGENDENINCKSR